MAKGKKKSVSSGGQHKKHGPKRKLFKEYKPMIRAFADIGLLDKYHNYDSWSIACASKGIKNVSRKEFSDFLTLSKEEQLKFFKPKH